jgi:hypothetical protein
MVILEAAAVCGVVGLLVYALIRLLAPGQAGVAQHAPGRWVVVHYDVKNATRVALRKLSVSSAAVLDEHVLSTIPIDDPDYDATFLAAMASARERRALFEAEEE